MPVWCPRNPGLVPSAEFWLVGSKSCGVDDGLPAALPLLAEVHAPHLLVYPGLDVWRSVLCVPAKQCFISSLASEAVNTLSVSSAAGYLCGLTKRFWILWESTCDCQTRIWPEASPYTWARELISCSQWDGHPSSLCGVSFNCRLSLLPCYSVLSPDPPLLLIWRSSKWGEYALTEASMKELFLY